MVPIWGLRTEIQMGAGKPPVSHSSSFSALFLARKSSLRRARRLLYVSSSLAVRRLALKGQDMENMYRDRGLHNTLGDIAFIWQELKGTKRQASINLTHTALLKWALCCFWDFKEFNVWEMGKTCLEVPTQLVAGGILWPSIYISCWNACAAW